MSDEGKAPAMSLASNVANAVKSEAGLVWSRLSSLATAGLLAALMTVGGFAFHTIMADQATTNDKIDARVGAVEAVLPAIQSQLSVQQSTISIFHQDNLANDQAVTQSLKDLKGELEAHTGTLSNIDADLAGITATLDIIKQRTGSSSISQLGNRLPDMSRGLPYKP